MSKTGFRVSVVCDSIARGTRLTSIAVRCPRPMWAEFLTHRAWSRNAASSRAIPVSYFVEQVESDPYLPGDLPGLPLMGNNSGMVANTPLDEISKRAIAQRYKWAATEAAASARHLAELGAHKQDANRLLEPFQWIRGLATFTEADNFFALRTDGRAYPPFCFLARCMYVAYRRSEPMERTLHLPFVTTEDWDESGVSRDVPDWFDIPYIGTTTDGGFVDRHELFNLFAWSTARCARVSVKNFRTDDTDRAKDMETFQKLTTEYPRHSSPAEHPAVALRKDNEDDERYCSNFRWPWAQFRKLIPLETVREFYPTPEEVAAWNVPDDVFGGTPGVDW